MRTNAVLLGCERLEARENPAGNVLVTLLPDGVLYVRGDASDNQVSVQQQTNGDLFAYGMSGTTVNNQAMIYLGRLWVTGVAVVGDAGNDLFEVIGVQTSGGFWGNMGNENDGLAMYSVKAAALNVNMEGGDDVVVTDSVSVGGYCRVDGGSGYDTIDYRLGGLAALAVQLPNVEKQVRNPYANNVLVNLAGDGILYLRGDAADNKFSIQQYANGDLFVYGVGGTRINGQSYIYVGRTGLNGVQVLADAGNDLVEMINIHTPGLISVQAGNENDGVALYNVSAGGMSLRMEGGDDTFVTDGVWVNGLAWLDGGSGYDTIDFRTYAIAALYPQLVNTERWVGGSYGY